MIKLLDLLREIVNSPQPQRTPERTPSREPTTIPRPTRDPGERPKRRRIGKEPAPGVNPRPKAMGENKSKDYGWDQKKGLVVKNLPKPAGTNKPKSSIKKEGMIDKIAQRYKSLR